MTLKVFFRTSVSCFRLGAEKRTALLCRRPVSSTNLAAILLYLTSRSQDTHLSQVRGGRWAEIILIVPQ